MNAPDVHVHLTIDREQEGWDGHVGFVPNYVKELGFDVNKTALICGPPIMIKFTLAGLEELGFSREQVYTTLELRMKCGSENAEDATSDQNMYVKTGPVFVAMRSMRCRMNTRERKKYHGENGKCIFFR